jgi:hypothetical protein
MADAVRTLNEKGIQAFRRYLADLREAPTGRPPWEILTDPGLAGKSLGDLEVERRAFKDKPGMAKYFGEKFSMSPASQIESNVGLWSWLSLYYFDQVCPVNPSGRRTPGQECRHILDLDFRRYYRHLLDGPYNVYRLHGERAPLLLYGPLDKISNYYEQLSCRQGFVTNKGVIEAANLLYINPRTGRPKYGPGGTGGKPGTLLRFIDVVQQLDLTHDLYNMTGEEVLSLLPPEFDEWRPKAGVKTRLLDFITRGKKKKEKSTVS